MSRLKQLLKIFMMVILITIGFATVSKADYKVGDTPGYYWNNVKNSNTVFCVEHGQDMTNHRLIRYKVISVVTIKGNTSTDHKGKTVTDRANVKLASILCSDAGITEKQESIWWFMKTWLHRVGQHHNGLYLSFASKLNEGSTDTVDEATEDADNYKEDMKIIDNTDKSNIKVKSAVLNNKSYIRVGPFNWDFAGELTAITLYDQNGQAVSKSGIKYSYRKAGEDVMYDKVADVKPNKNFYIWIPTSKGITKITKIKGEEDVKVDKVKIAFLQSQSGAGWQNLIKIYPGSAKEKVEATFEYQIELVGDLKVIKVDQNNVAKPLKGVKFIFQRKEDSTYVSTDSNGNIVYVTDRNSAKQYATGDDGKITITNLIVGDYIAYEVENPNKLYEVIKDGIPLTVTVDKTAEAKQIGNRQIFINLSGYVWLDENSAKSSTRDYEYISNNGSQDQLLDGITVRLMRNNVTIATTTTSELKRYIADGNNGHGEYLFQMVPMYDENNNFILNQYYIEFDYDGITYTNILPKITQNNGSKAAEDAGERETFNKRFSVIDGSNVNAENDTGLSRIDLNDNSVHNLTYTRDKENYKSTINHEGPVTITASTTKTGYSLPGSSEAVAGTEEIKYINLGIERREQPDLALLKDLDNIRLGINGYQHIYKYDEKKNYATDYQNGFNVGVKFEKRYSEGYSRAVYKSDADYETEDKSKELTAYMTYKIEITNGSSLTNNVQKIVDYYDERFEKTSVYRLNEKGEKQELENAIDNSYSKNGYSKLVITTNSHLESGKTDVVYVEFKLSRQAIKILLATGDDQVTLRNVAEILKYSTQKDGKPYAGFDKNSVPGNAIPEDARTYEDDTDKSPNLKLELAEARKLEGTVFEDKTADELQTGEIRQGDGEFKDGEPGIKNVTVKLVDERGNTVKIRDKSVADASDPSAWKDAVTVTDNDGNFTFEGFIPGKYKVVYTWGDDEYSVEQYKGTIYQKPERASDVYWYKIEQPPRYSDAMDNYETRKRIDQQTNKLPYSFTGEKIKTMDSTTPVMNLNIENSDVISDDKLITTSSKDIVEYSFAGVDFGIVERARQAMSIEKTVSHIRVELDTGTGTPMLDSDVEKGKIKNGAGIAVYISPSMGNDGMVKVEMADKEMIEGSRVTIDYKIRVDNLSEKDYATEEYYLYGTEGTDNDLVKLTPKGVYDYLDKELVQTDKTNGDWQVKTLMEYNYDVGPMTIKEFRDKVSSSSTITTTEEQNGTTITTTTTSSMSKEYEYYSMEQSSIDSWKTKITESRLEGFKDKTILYTEKLSNPIAPGDGNEVSLQASKVLTNTDEIELNNETEITKIEKNGGAIPNLVRTEYDNEKKLFDQGEVVVITPNTGENRNYAVILSITLGTLVILGAGVVLIKKKVLHK